MSVTTLLHTQNPNKPYYLKNYGNTNYIYTAASLASTWIWAPAIYVSSEIAAQYNILGLLFFLIPNILTLVALGVFADRIKEMLDGYTIFQYIKANGTKTQYTLHVAIGILLLLCSTVVQLIGLKLLLLHLFADVNAQLILLPIIAIIFVYMSYGGIKMSIYTDVVKYIAILVCSVLLVSTIDISNVDLVLHEPIDMIKTFGITTAIGLILAPYVDQTMWQRIFCVNKKDIKKMCLAAAFFFGIIPALTGIIGLSHFYSDSFNIVSLYTNYPYNIIIFILVFCTLVSTIDSNLSAISSIVWNELNLENHKGYAFGIISQLSLLMLSYIIAISDVKIIGMFLMYGMLRTTVGIPTILLLTNRCNRVLIEKITILSIMIMIFGYVLLESSYNYILSIMALFLPFLAYKNKSV